MPETAIYECTKCNGLLIAGKTQKTRSCPYCGAKINLQKAKRLATANDAFQASEMLRRLKAERKHNPKTTSK